ncbi:DUF6525 family protein [Jannaschia sp. 2305UL9-9]|uniref:DUF6525 family protein n=1 Tax=Jannaschia sp. 2305UL9-9 TaxID=3121638 RepID=UPI003526CCC0
MRGNLGATTLRRRKRACDPMQVYDNLPPELRRWMSQAALPWSPRSCERLWRKARRKGLCAEAATDLLSRAEAKTLARDRIATSQ